MKLILAFCNYIFVSKKKKNKLFGYSTACDETIKKILKPEIRIPRQIGKKEVYK